MRVTYISWAASCSRSDNTARELGGNSFMVYMSWLGSNPLTILLKYAGQALQTLRILVREKPEAVFVMSPPVIAVLPVWLYALVRRVPFVIDAHTAAFMHPRWTRFQWLQAFLERRAATTIVTNDHLASVVRERGGHATIVRDVPVVYAKDEPYPLNGKFSIAAVCSFNPDEPIAEIFEAAEACQDVHFYMTGKIKDLDPAVASKKPENVTLTGFIPDGAYGSLISNANAVLTLTTRDHTMLRGAYEAIYQGTPVIISDWPLLRDAFSRGALHTDNTAAGLKRAIRELQQAPESFREEARALREQKLTEWQTSRQNLAERLRR